MKLAIATILLFGQMVFAKGMTYEPFQFTCTYDASNDGPITLVSEINPDNDNMTVLLKSALNNETTSLEAESAYVYLKDEKIDANLASAIQSVAATLNIDSSKWYTTTDITVNLGGPMHIFKFNSEDGTLGIGIYVSDFGQNYTTVCK